MPPKGLHRSFGLPSNEPLSSSVDHAPWDNDHVFHDLPDPNGQYPFHLDLAEVLADSEMTQINKSRELVFHTAGDTGNVRGKFQEEVAGLMVEEAAKSNVKF